MIYICFALFISLWTVAGSLHWMCTIKQKDPSLCGRDLEKQTMSMNWGRGNCPSFLHPPSFLTSVFLILSSFPFLPSQVLLFLFFLPPPSPSYLPTLHISMLSISLLLLIISILTTLYSCIIKILLCLVKP